MKPLIPIIIIAVISILAFCLYMAVGKIRDLEKAKKILRDKNSKLSDALRRKGIEIDGLKKKIKRLKKDV